MDAAAGIIGFAGFGLQVCQSLLAYYSSWKGCRPDIAAICASVQETQMILTTLNDAIRQRGVSLASGNGAGAAAAGMLPAVVQSCRNVMDKLSETAQKIQRGAGDDGFRMKTRATWERVKYPFKESTLLKLRDLLHQAKLDVLLVLKILDIDTSSATVIKLDGLDQKIDELRLKVAGVEGSVRGCEGLIERLDYDKSHRDLLTWLCDKDVGMQQREASAKRYPGTCNWVFERPEFHRWKAHGSVLWISGGIGCGKSVMCSAVVDHMTQYCDTNPGNLLLYFYFSFREKSKQVQHRCQSALLKQICREPKALREVKRLYDQAHKDSVPVSAQFGDVKACLDTTIKDLKGLKQVFIVLDALDELDNDLDDLQRTQMLQWIISVTTHESHVHVLFTSRSRSGRGDIEHAMDLHPDVLKIHIDAKANQDDMCLYLTDQFQASTALSSLPRASKKDLCDRLIGMADGMFLWTHCQLADLVKLPFLRPKDIRVILESMPKTLESTYSRILEDVSKFMLTEVVQALQWLSVALRPLTLQEINEACIIRLLELPIIDKDNQLPGDGVLSCLPGLVSRTIKDHDEYVLLAHFSVREFLMSRAAVKRGSSEAPFTFRDCTAHALIAESCIAYINYWCNRAPKNKMCAGAELKSFPLLQYACQHWAEHLNQTDENEQARLASAALQLLTRPEYITDVLSVYNPLEDWEKRPWRSWSRPSSSEHNLISHLGWAAVLGLPSVTTLVLRGTNPALNERGRIQDSTRSSMLNLAFMKAVEFNHPEVARLLIDHGADIHEKSSKGYSAFFIACEIGRESLVELLLENGADPNEEIQGLLPLMLCIRSGSLSACKLLLNTGACVEATNCRGETPLSVAVLMQADLEILELLLDRGADVNKRLHVTDEWHIFWTYTDVLSVAAMQGDVERVQFLLSKGAHISPDALAFALTGIEDGPFGLHPQVCKLLIQQGASLIPPMGWMYESPLAMALRNLRNCGDDWSDVVDLMLEHASVVQPEDPTGLLSGNILVAAAMVGVEVTTRILKLGVDANAPVRRVETWPFEDIFQPRDFDTAIQAAAYYLNFETVQLLLAHGADVNLPGLPYGNPLFATFATIVSPDDPIPSAETNPKVRSTLAMLVLNGAEMSIPWEHISYDGFRESIEGINQFFRQGKNNIPLPSRKLFNAILQGVVGEDEDNTSLLEDFCSFVSCYSIFQSSMVILEESRGQVLSLATP